MIVGRELPTLTLTLIPGLTRGPCVLWGEKFVRKGEYKVSMQAATEIKLGVFRIDYLDLLTTEMPIIDTLVALGYKDPIV